MHSGGKQFRITHENWMMDPASVPMHGCKRGETTIRYLGKELIKAGFHAQHIIFSRRREGLPIAAHEM